MASKILTKYDKKKSVLVPVSRNKARRRICSGIFLAWKKKGKSTFETLYSSMGNEFAYCIAYRSKRI